MNLTDQISIIKMTPQEGAPVGMQIACAAINVAGFFLSIFLIGLMFGYGFHLTQ